MVVVASRRDIHWFARVERQRSTYPKPQEPGRIYRAKRYLLAQFPVHPQYIDPGTVYFAELQAPLDF
jgi:hypothetical protein